MLKQNPVSSGQEDMLRNRLEQIIDLRHELVTLSRLVDWEGLATDLGVYYCPNTGRRGESIRLMAGLILLKEIKGISDEEVCFTWRENPYFQYFCGEEYFQHRLPVEPPSLSIFRKRIGEAGMEVILAQTIRIGLRSKTLQQKHLKRVTVDTTVQEKAVRYPTDTRLCHKARQALVALAKQEGVPLRQSYVRKGRYALFKANKYAAVRQMKRSRKYQKEVRNYLGRVIRDVQRRGVSGERWSEALHKATIIYNQAGNPKAQEKLYSWHAPEVECIAKGKAHKRYEFGCKTSFISTHEGNFIVGAQALHGKPYDGHTLQDVLARSAEMSGIRAQEVYADGGYRGHKLKDASTTVILPKQKRGLTKAQMKRRKRRNAIEPIIGHCKNDRKTGARNWLKGVEGDKINALAMAIGYNMRKILRHILLWLKILKALHPLNFNNPTQKSVF